MSPAGGPDGRGNGRGATGIPGRPEVAATDGPRRRLAAALRPVIAMTVAGLFEDEDVAEAAEALEHVSARMAGRAGPGRLQRRPPNAAQEPQEYFPTSPITGLDNPVSPPVRIEVVDGEGPSREIRAEAWFDYPFEGPPTCVHGGVIAQTFDELLGTANIVAGHPAMTGTLTVVYRKPTPLRTPLRIEARCVSSSGRKILTRGAMYHGDVLTAEAEGIFIEVAPRRFLAIAEENVEGTDPATLEIMRTEAGRHGAASDVPGFLDVPDPSP